MIDLERLSCKLQSFAVGASPLARFLLFQGHAGGREGRSGCQEAQAARFTAGCKRVLDAPLRFLRCAFNCKAYSAGQEGNNADFVAVKDWSCSHTSFGVLDVLGCTTA
jgi:hypothetical protein